MPRRDMSRRWKLGLGIGLAALLAVIVLIGIFASNPQRTKDPNARAAIVFEDDANFDGLFVTALLQKDPTIDLKLKVVGNGFGSPGTSSQTVFDFLAWLGNEETPVVVGAYHTDQEVNAGANPTFAQHFLTGGCIDGACDGTFTTFGANDVCLQDASGPRVGQVSQPIFPVPPLWKDNGATLYGTIGRIPRNKNPNRQYVSSHCDVEPFVPAHDHVANVLSGLLAEGKKAIIFHTGSATDFARYILKYNSTYNAAIERVVVMGGGFYNFANPNDTTSQRWAGNGFADLLFALTSADPVPLGYTISNADMLAKSQFRTMAEENMRIDPLSAKIMADFLFSAPFPTLWVPTDATDSLLIGNLLDSLALSPTPEGKYFFHLIEGIKRFEAGAFPFVIRLWDIIAAETVLNPEIIEESIQGKVDVVTLTNADIDPLKQVACGINPPSVTGKNPFNVMTYNSYVGQTTIDTNNVGSITVVTKVNHALAIQILLDRLNSPVNQAISPMNYE